MAESILFTNAPLYPLFRWKGRCMATWQCCWWDENRWVGHNTRKLFPMLPHWDFMFPCNLKNLCASFISTELLSKWAVCYKWKISIGTMAKEYKDKPHIETHSKSVGQISWQRPSEEYLSIQQIFITCLCVHCFRCWVYRREQNRQNPFVDFTVLSGERK